MVETGNSSPPNQLVKTYTSATAIERVKVKIIKYVIELINKPTSIMPCQRHGKVDWSAEYNGISKTQSNFTCTIDSTS